RGIRSELPALLRALAERRSREEFWIRLLYAYPIGVNEELVNLIRDEPAICSYLDLPLQHISHSVLKRMQRPLGEKGTRALIESMRHAAPEVHLRTTFIVGFPGETEEDVRALEKFVAEGHFTHVGVFTYSQEEEAQSFSMSDQIELEEREARRARVMAAQQRVVEESHEALFGSRMRVLVEGFHEETELLLSSRAEWQAPETDGETIINEFDESYGEVEPSEVLARLKGTFVDVEVTESAGYDLVARLLPIS
ncbi:MAG: radical SAM protein, partial [Bdellovibrionales bacterium]|nr:radical SAM protein [Bdellovibrionales bacterium]